MNDSIESIDQRRARLTAEIARQRGDLATAYSNLSKPIQYGEYALRGFGFARQNAWIFSAIPATFTVGSAILSLLGIAMPRKETASGLTAAQRKRLAELERERVAKGMAGKLMKWSGHGFRAYRLYRRFRHYFT